MENRKKRGGRSKGTPNKLTSELRQAIKNVVSNQMENLERDMKRLTPYQRLDLTIKLMGYCLPKLQPSETDKVDDNKIEVVFVQGKTIL